MKDTSPACRYYFDVTCFERKSSIQEICLERIKYILQLLLSRSLCDDVLQHMHSSVVSGHLGVKKTTEKVKKLFHRYKMRTDIRIWIEKCHTCQKNKVSNKSIKAPMGEICVDYQWIDSPLTCRVP